MQKKKKNRRDVDGVFLLDKPLGVSSNHALQSVRRLFFANKAGHTGSLDPLASGLLPICFGEATKYSQYLLQADKQYDFTFKLGEVTETGDAEGKVMLARPWDHITVESIRGVVAHFLGDSLQIPPMYSALKHKGKPLYKLAREGVEVPREPRPITVYDLKIKAINLPFVECAVHCSKGTYVRTLATDIGEQLGCGAHVTHLRRTKIGDICGSRMMTMDALIQKAEQFPLESLDQSLIPIVDFLTELPAQGLLPNVLQRFNQGQSVPVPPGLPIGEPIRVIDAVSGHFCGIGIFRDELLRPKRLCQSRD